MVLVYVVPLILKVRLVKLELTVMVPVATLHVGCIIVAVGASGDSGCAAIVCFADCVDTHPDSFLAVT